MQKSKNLSKMLLSTQHGYGAQNVDKYTTFLQLNKYSCEQYKIDLLKWLESQYKSNKGYTDL